MPSITGANGPSKTPKPASSQNSIHEDDENRLDLEYSNSDLNIPYIFEAIDDQGISHLRRAVHIVGMTRSIVTRNFVEDLGYRTFPLTPTLHLQSRDADEFVPLKVRGTLLGASFLDLSIGVSSEMHRPESPDIYIYEATQKRIGQIQTLYAAPIEDLCRATPDQERPVDLATPSFTRAHGKVELEHRLSSATLSNNNQDDGPCMEFREVGLVKSGIPDSTDSHSGTGNAPVFTSRGLPQSSIPTSIESEEASCCSAEGRVDHSVKTTTPEGLIDCNLLSRNYMPKARRK